MEEKRDRGYRVKTINSIISKKFNELVLSIKDDKVQRLVQHNTIITGGCIASMLQGDEANDFDLYFTNKETVLAVANYYVNSFNESHPNLTNKAVVMDGATYNAATDQLGGVGLNMTADRVKIIIRSSGTAGEAPDNGEEDYVEPVGEAKPVTEEEKKRKPPYRPVYLTCNAISLANNIQLVIRFYGTPGEIHDNYDFVHCTNFWESSRKELVLNIAAMQAILAKELVYIGSKYPVASMIRIRKFIGRGWVINAGQMLKIAFQISQLDLTKIEVLEDQCVGVDVAYFNELIHTMQKREDRRPEWIDYGYLANLIDKLF